MNESPIFSRTYDLLLWLLPQAIKFPRAYRFTLAERVQRRALDMQETLIAAGLRRGPDPGHSPSTDLPPVARREKSVVANIKQPRPLQ